MCQHYVLWHNLLQLPVNLDLELQVMDDSRVMTIVRAWSAEEHSQRGKTHLGSRTQRQVPILVPGQ